tara:strand:- start:2467 stop:2649 length:183 start_codon:yes stop_codon:yes gene_type:complete
MKSPNDSMRKDLKRIGELSLEIIEKAKHQKLGLSSGAKTFDQAVQINHLAQKIYKILDAS